MIAAALPGVQLIIMVGAALFSIIRGLTYLQQRHNERWFNQPNILLGIGLIFFALLDFTATSFYERVLDKLIAFPCMIVFFLSITFFIMRAIMIFVRNFA